MHGTITRRTAISIETHSVTIIRTKLSNSGFVTCSTCGCDVRAIDCEQAATLLGIDNETIRLLAAGASIHFASEGHICGLSLIEHFCKDETIITEPAA